MTTENPENTAPESNSEVQPQLADSIKAAPPPASPPPAAPRSSASALDTMGNPHASESDWLQAAEQMNGEYQAKSQKHSKNNWVAFFALLGLCSIVFVGSVGAMFFNMSQQIHQIKPSPAPTAVPLRPSHFTPRPAVGPQADVDFGPYMANLQRRIKRAWFPPKGTESKRVVVTFKVHQDGSITNLKLSHSSGAAIADTAALSAVQDAAPFAPLPAGASENVDIQFTFDYNVFSGGHPVRQF